ncbi:MAG: S8 family serine peptidase [Pseudomonadota bacterium]
MRLFRLARPVHGMLIGAALAAVAGVHAQTNVSALAVPSSAPSTAQQPAGSGNDLVPLFVRLGDAPLAAVAGNKRSGMKMTADQQRAYTAQLAAKQATLMSQIGALGGRQVASLTKASNALVVEVAASQAPVIARLPGVAQVLQVGDYQLDLATTVPYIGASVLQAAGLDGTGVRVAVLDSGVDFMHYNLGGTGSVADYNTCYAQANVAPSGICASFFGPTAPKVIGGYDFVGEVWTGLGGTPPLQPDPNPIARTVTGGHGNNVADIILGRSADGVRKGVAPGAKLYAVKVCSALGSPCSGIAMLQGIDFSLDPNQDGDLSDAVDVINMSFGASYGQRENPTVFSTNAASQFGVVVVASAGNSANRPFITGSPSMSTSAISVAQTQVPTATVLPLVITAPASIAGTITNTNTMAWAPGTFAGNVKATAASPGAPPANDACAALPSGSLTGFVAIVRRGTCSGSDKVTHAANAGAVGIIIDNNAAGDPPSFSQGPPVAGGAIIPALVLTQADGNTIRTRLAAGDTVTANTGTPISAAGSIVAISSRGPSNGIGQIKPDIGARGASLSAEVGTGNGQSVFGGTSGAAPMVAGSAALLLQQNPALQPHEVKARLMNAAETNVTLRAGPASATNPLLPITRIGAGEVRVNRSAALTTGAWDASDPAAVSLSMGVTRNVGTQVYRKRVLVRNYANVARTYTIGRSFRYANDQASGGVTLSAPATVSVPANGSATFMLTATVNAALLPTWASTGVNGGAAGGDGSLLDLPEYDGYVTIADATDTVRLPWHILPHRAHNVVAPASIAMGGAASAPLAMTNAGGSVDGRVEAFYLTGTSPQLPPSQLPGEGDGYAVIDLRAVGVRLVQIGGTNEAPVWGIQFAVNTWGARSHPNYPAGFAVQIDVNNDGTPEFEAFTTESGTFASSGQNVTALRKLSTTTGSVFFFTDTDLATGNVIMTIPMVTTTLPGTGPQLSLTPTSTFSFTVRATDNYFTGLLSDSIGPMQVNLANPRFIPNTFTTTVPVGGTTTVTMTRNSAGDAVSPAHSGMLMMYRDAQFGRETGIVQLTP